jgi:hypothetical protein
MFGLLSEIPFRIEKVRDNLGGEVFRHGRGGCYFGPKFYVGEVATVTVSPLPSISRKPREWPARLPERRLCPAFRRSASSTRRLRRADQSK